MLNSTTDSSSPGAPASSHRYAAFATASLRSRRIGATGESLLINRAGRFAVGAPGLSPSELTSVQRAELQRKNILVEPTNPLALLADQYAREERADVGEVLDYLILVPTLRCNLSCTYCQVSRVSAERTGFDWDTSTLQAVLHLLDSLPSDQIKIEFQGGEATLRPDLIEAVISRCERFDRKEFVVCTNLQRLDARLLAIFDHADVFISTSLDGLAAVHQMNRTRAPDETDQFFTNLSAVIARWGPEKVSALPTINAEQPPEPAELIEAFAAFGLTNIFLRPINYHGFARKRHRSAREQGDDWRAYHRRFVEVLIERNWADQNRVFEETYLGLCMRRIFRPCGERHVDLRSPNPVGEDYIVIDYDGTVYPTDEARMLARSGVINLALGDVFSGWDSEVRQTLNRHSSNAGDADCEACAFQPYCGRDLVDELARYGRIDMPRSETEFCRKHMAIFDLAFELLTSSDPATLYSVRNWLRLPRGGAIPVVRLP